jgi:outer membrane immunogenic protein
MRTQLLAATALTSSIGFLVPGAAVAQTPYNWTGFYAGISGGVVNSQATIDFSYSGSAISLPSSVKIPAIGEIGTVTIGHDWQNGQFVYGLAGDMSVLKLNGSATDTSTYSVTDSLNTLLSLRARFGVAFDRMMLFATAGVAGGNASFNSDVGKGSSGHYQAASASGPVTGTIVGVGAEYAVNDHVSITAGAKYYNLSPLSGVGDTGKGLGADPYSATYKPAGTIFEAGLNVRF